MAHLTSLPHYEAHAGDYVAALLAHDTSDSRARFLARLPAPADILDVGCGPGRDLAAFRQAGHRAIGLEGSPSLAAVARAHAGAEIWQRDLFALDLPAKRFDGVWAQAMLFHVPTQALPTVLGHLRVTLREGGILYVCDPTGDNAEGWMEDRYIALRRPRTMMRHIRDAGFKLLEDWRRPPGVPRRDQGWLATLWSRT